jgi:hypothetical protein
MQAAYVIAPFYPIQAPDPPRFGRRSRFAGRLARNMKYSKRMK